MRLRSSFHGRSSPLGGRPLAAGVLGEKYVQPPVLDYKSIFRQSSAMTPVVFVLSPGADPAFDVFKLGEEMGFKPGTKLKYMALGQGMGPKAQEFIETGSTRGLWIMLQVPCLPHRQWSSNPLALPLFPRGPSTPMAHPPLLSLAACLFTPALTLFQGRYHHPFIGSHCTIRGCQRGA